MLKKNVPGGYVCPLSFTIKKCEHGWTELEAVINGERIKFQISGIWEDQNPSNLLQTAYLFNPYIAGNINERFDIDYDLVDGEYKNFADIPLKSEFEWDSEPYITKWCIYMPLAQLEEKEATLYISIKKNIGKEESKEYYFEIKYRDFCYAVGKCFSDYLKQASGVEQYHVDSFGDEINLRYLVFAKAYGMGLIGKDISFMECYRGSKETLSFQEELEVLAMDM